MVRVVLDTNVYVSAFQFGGRPEEVFLLAESRLLSLFISPALYAELRRVLRLKFGYSTVRVEQVITRVSQTAELVNPRVVVSASKDPDDNRVLECAVEARAQYIVTGDRVLLALDPFQGIRIVNPAAFIHA